MTHRLRIRSGMLDLAQATLTRPDGAAVSLTTREVALLRALAAHPGEDVPRDALLREVWGHHPASLSRAVDTTVARLRRKIELHAEAPSTLCTSHREGYRLVLAADRAEIPPPVSSARRTLRVGQRTVDLDAGIVRGPGGTVSLTGQERSLLERLACSLGRVVDPEALGRAGHVIGGRAALANAVHRLREKLDDGSGAPSPLVTLRGQGYRLDGERDAGHPPLVRTQTLWSLAAYAARALELEDCVIYVREGEGLVQVAAFGPKAPTQGQILRRIHLPIGRGIVGEAARTGQGQCVPDVRSDPRYVPDAYPGRSELAVPLLHDGEVVGVLDSESPRLDAYDAHARATFDALAQIAAAAISDLRVLAA